MSDPTSGSSAAAGRGARRLVFGDHAFDPANGILARDESEIALRPRPLAVLRLLLERRGEVVSKQDLLDQVWSDTVVGEATLAEAISTLRKALGDKPRDPVYIQTLHRRGYRFIAEVSSEPIVEHSAADSMSAPPVTDSAPHPAPATTAALAYLPAFVSRRLIAALLAIGAVVGISGLAGLSLPSAGGPPIAVGNGRTGGPSVSAAGEIDGEEAEDVTAWVLIADFAGPGNANAGTATESALRAALGASGFAAAVPRQRTDATLRLMRRAPGSPIDAATGRELSLRDGEIRALVTGRVQPGDSGDVLTIDIVDPVTGLTVASVRGTVAANDAAASSDLAGRAVAALHEQIPALSGVPEEHRLEKVTTSSLRALQLFAQAGGTDNERPAGIGGLNAAVGSGNRGWLPEMYGEAVSEDPAFAAAHIMLAWAIKNTGGAYDDYIAHAERAVELAEDVTPAEEYWIRGSYERFRGNFAAAITHYQALLYVEPEHPWALGNIINALHRYTPRFEEAVPYLVMTAESSPGEWFGNALTASALAIWGNDPSGAAVFYRRARALLPESGWVEGAAGSPRLQLWAQLYPLHQRWLDGDVEAVSEELDRLSETLTAAVSTNAWPVNRVNGVARGLGAFHLALGKLSDAEAAYELITLSNIRAQHLAIVAVARNGEADPGSGELPELPATRRTIPDLNVAVTIQTRAGDVAGARRSLAALEAQWAVTPVDLQQALEPYVTLARAELALAEDRVEQIESGWSGSVYTLRPTGGISYFRGVETLASYWEAVGDLDETRRTLEAASRERARSLSAVYFPGRNNYLWFAHSEWMRVRWKLAVVNRKLGRLAEARAIEDELRELLVAADADLWLVRQLRTLENVGATARTR